MTVFIGNTWSRRSLAWYTPKAKTYPYETLTRHSICLLSYLAPNLQDKRWIVHDCNAFRNELRQVEAVFCVCKCNRHITKVQIYHNTTAIEILIAKCANLQGVFPSLSHLLTVKRCQCKCTELPVELPFTIVSSATVSRLHHDRHWRWYTLCCDDQW
jgi:hypothetical protein